MAFSREIIIGILQNVRFRIPKQEKNSYYTTIGNTLVRISNHCTWMYVWDNYLEQNPKCKGMNIVSLVFEDNGNTFSNDCLVLKRVRNRPIKVGEYVFSLYGDGQFISRMDINTIINDLRRLQQSKDYTDSTGKSNYCLRISVNPTNNKNKQYKSNNMKQTIKLTENELRNMIKRAIKESINEVKYGGETFHGNNEVDWYTMRNLRNDRVKNDDDMRWSQLGLFPQTDKDYFDSEYNDITAQRDMNNGTSLPGSSLENIVDTEDIPSDWDKNYINKRYHAYRKWDNVNKAASDKANRIRRNLKQPVHKDEYPSIVC